MPNIKSILIAALVLSNAVTGVVLWKTYEQTQYQTQKAHTFAALFENESKKNYRLETKNAIWVKTAKGKKVPIPSYIFDSLDKPLRKAAMQTLAESLAEYEN